MRRALILIPLLLTTACATPQEACIASANREVRALNGLINETRGNLARGYAISERQEVRINRKTCRGQNEDGTNFVFPCEETETVTVRDRVAIDLNAERAKLSSLEQRQQQNQANAQTAVQQCVALNPE